MSPRDRHALGHELMAILDMSIIEDLRGLDRSGEGEFLRQIIGVFEEQAIQIVADLKQASIDGDFDRVCSLAHKLKGSARTVGAAELGDHCERLERESRAGPVATLEPLLDAIFGAMTRARASLHQQLD